MTIPSEDSSLHQDAPKDVHEDDNYGGKHMSIHADTKTDDTKLMNLLLGRTPVVVHGSEAHDMLRGRRVLVTGAAGSIGSELARQLHALGADVYFLDCDESRLHALKLSIDGDGLLNDRSVVLADIRDGRRVHQVFLDVRPEIVYHAAAHKHLPLLERYPSEGVKTNVLGTENLTRAATITGVDRFILVSTDKAADPTSVLGATKRLAECVVSSFAGGHTRFASVRFGNVLGSRGSFLDTLRHQVRTGVPVSITHPDVERFFMSVYEAVGLVIEASVMAHRGETYVLDMGQPVKIIDLVTRYADAIGAPCPEINIVGLRDGEKLSESLFSEDEQRQTTAHNRIWRTEQPAPGFGFNRDISRLYSLADDCDDDSVFELLDRMTMRLTMAA